MSESQTVGFKLASRLREGAAVGGVRGAFVPHLLLHNESIIRQVVAVARAARLNVLYPCALRYSRALFHCTRPGTVPKYSYAADDGRSRELNDELGAFQQAVESSNEASPSEPIKVIPWVECFLKARKPDADHLLLDAKYEAKLKTTFPVLDVSDERTRDLLLNQLVDLAKVSSADTIHVDDHLAYDLNVVPPKQAAEYRARLTDFVTWLVPKFKQLTGKSFELSCSPPAKALKQHHADVLRWPVDRIVVQAYKPTAESIIGRSGWSEIHGDLPIVTGVGATCFGTFRKDEGEKQVSDQDLLKVMRHVANKKKLFVLWHIGDLLDRKKALVPAMAALAPPLPR